MKEAREEGERWLLQSENDLACAELGVREGFSAQVCFLAPQICEKALKAVHYGAQPFEVYSRRQAYPFCSHCTWGCLPSHLTLKGTP